MITGEVSGGEQAAQQIDGFFPILRDRVDQAVLELTRELKSRAFEILGEQVRLHGSALLRGTFGIERPEADLIVGVVGSSVGTLIFNEDGHTGEEAVHDYLRHVTMNWGRPIAEHLVHVAAYNRFVDYPEGSFLRAALIDLEPLIVSTLERVAVAAVIAV